VWQIRQTWGYRLHWPIPLWRVAGRGWLEIGGYRFVFEDVGRSPHSWWGRRVHDGGWELDEIAFMAQHVRPGDTVLDIGAYVGPYSLLASRLVGRGGLVFAFEPDPVARRLLMRNLALNEADNVIVLPWAVSDRDGSIWLRSEGFGNANATTDPEQGDLEVASITLPSFCGRFNVSPAVIKIDVEGGETDIVTDASLPVLERARAVLIEVHEQALRGRGIDPAEFRARSERAGKTLLDLGERTTANYSVGLV
jgi:FkbM family methyltransferase